MSDRNTLLVTYSRDGHFLNPRQFQKFVSKFHVSKDGCWNWVGAIHKISGYGALSVRSFFDDFKKCYLAHRVSYRLFRGEIAEHLEVCHTCDSRRCVNPSHLFLGTRLDNVTDCKFKGRTRNAALVVSKGRVHKGPKH